MITCNFLPSLNIKDWNPAKSFKECRPAIQKIKDIALKVFQSIKELVLFPVRYFQSKTWTISDLIIHKCSQLSKKLFGGSINETPLSKNYHFAFQKELSEKEMKSYLPHACAAAFVHGCKSSFVPIGWDIISPQDLEIKDENLSVNKSCYFDEKSGLKIALLSKGNDVIVAFGALRSSESEIEDSKKNDDLFLNGNYDAIINLLGGVPSIYPQAEEFFCKLQNEAPFLKGKNVFLVGQCFGGSIAQFVSLKHNDTQAVGFNTLSIGAGLQKEIDFQSLIKADDRLTHISIKGDWLTDFRVMGKVDEVISRIGITTPGLFGKKYTIPSAYTSAEQTHNFVLGSVMKYLGQSERSHPVDIDPSFFSIVED